MRARIPPARRTIPSIGATVVYSGNVTPVSETRNTSATWPGAASANQAKPTASAQLAPPTGRMLGKLREFPHQ